MQSLFAYVQSRDSNFNIAKQKIHDAFAKDLNSMEEQNPERLKSEKEEAIMLFNENYKLKGALVTSSEVEKVNSIVTKTIEDYYQDLAKDQKLFRNNMVIEAEKVELRYVMMLMLFEEFAQVAETDKKYNASNFVKNLLIKSIKYNKSVENVKLRYNLSWTDRLDKVRDWYREVLRNDEVYNNYLNLAAPGFDDDKEIITYIAKSIIFKSEIISADMEEWDIYWSENKPIIRSMVLKTFKELSVDNVEDFELAEISYNWEEDKDFFVLLFNETLNLADEFKELISLKTKNWDIDRLAVIDKIILEMGIAEMMNFPSIPVKVTINEYIELAKSYSTPKSKQFINGILDVISKELINNGSIRKSGRGLIDNK